MSKATKKRSPTKAADVSHPEKARRNNKCSAIMSPVEPFWKFQKENVGLFFPNAVSKTIISISSATIIRQSYDWNGGSVQQTMAVSASDSDSVLVNTERTSQECFMTNSDPKLWNLRILTRSGKFISKMNKRDGITYSSIQPFPPKVPRFKNLGGDKFNRLLSRLNKAEKRSCNMP
ncbi:hypothetical protein WA026_006870 [Henosepilachna vigintioctopunctata]|uniref:Uncharacterized protein n=1 Tax=Henosepilachna vigintioctopunctata TaxID=420089 RepID=A0AAW1UJA8_9CUCU